MLDNAIRQQQGPGQAAPTAAAGALQTQLASLNCDRSEVLQMPAATAAVQVTELSSEELQIV
jgi:hypothetical protein